MSQLKKIRQLAKEINASYKINKTGVPHIIKIYRGKMISICYFKKNDIYRIFSPYGATEQNKIDFKNKQLLIDYLNA